MRIQSAGKGSLPRLITGKPVDCNCGLLSINYGLRCGIVAFHFGLLGFPARDHSGPLGVHWGLGARWVLLWCPGFLV